MGNYPEDYEILAHTLYQFWIAEGFISLDEERRGKEETLMDVAERYLGELAQRSMVQVLAVKVEDEGFEGGRIGGSKQSHGRFKSCRLHDLMRQMCLSMVKEENFLKVIDHEQSSERQSRSFFRSKIHRLAIHGHENIDQSNLCIDQEKNIRAVLFLGENDDTRCHGEFVSHLAKNFKLARVMHLEGFFSKGKERVKLQKAVGDLIHLRYFGWVCNSHHCGTFELPSSVGNLRYLQTLDLSNIPFFPVIIPNVLWKLKQLMHLYLPHEWKPPKSVKLRLDGLDNLELLENFNPEFFIIEDLPKLGNLRSLRVCVKGNRQDLVAFVDYLKSVTREQPLLRHSSLFIQTIGFCTEDGPALLKQIFFECHPLHHLQISGSISELPAYQESSHSSLTHLFLSYAGLGKASMAILEKLPNLAVLALWMGSYIDKKMVCSSRGFARLKRLELVMLSDLEDWRVDAGAMPNLSYLEISECSKLETVPDGLKAITSLQELSIKFMPQAFVKRLKSPDGVDFHKVSHIPCIKIGAGTADNEEEDTIESSVE